MNGTKKINKFKKDPTVIKFITSLIENNFHKNNAPKWVNYDLFFKEMFDQCFYYLVNNLRDEFYVYEDHNLAYGYVSGNLDVGIGSSNSIFEGFCEIEIPKEIIEIYKNMWKV